jgi:hypothetical protein
VKVLSKGRGLVGPPTQAQADAKVLDLEEQVKALRDAKDRAQVSVCACNEIHVPLLSVCPSV